MSGGGYIHMVQWVWWLLTTLGPPSPFSPPPHPPCPVGKLQEKITKMVDTINLVLLPRMQELNSALPPELQLEPFQYVLY